MNIVNNVSWITDREIDLLKANAALPFSLGNFSSLGDILTKLNVEVVIEPGTAETSDSHREESILQHWKKEAERLKIRLESDSDSDERYQEAIRNIEELNQGLINNTKNITLGMYGEKEKVILLYPDVMRKKNEGHRVNELLVSILVHETMHAYFSRYGLGKYPFVHYVEEPLAVFGMLLFLHETGSGYYQWAYDDVKSKRNCYRYGAMLMAQHLKEGADSSARLYLERYPIRLKPYTMLSVDKSDGTVSLPQGNTVASPIIVDGQRLYPCWESVQEYPTKYYYDKSSDTLCIDGDWGEMRIDDEGGFVIESRIELFSYSIKRVYLGAHFYTDDASRVYPIRLCPVYVSPRNKYFAEINNIPVYKNDNKPFLRSCGKGMYDICRNGKWGVIDENLNQVIPYKYDGIGSFSKNGLIEVSIRLEDGRLLYGLADRQGVERVPVVYESIRRTAKGIWIFGKDGEEHAFDRFGKRVEAQK